MSDACSFSKAAERLYISTTAVIKQINLLESDLQLQLLVRTHRGLSLTQAGHSLYQDAKYIIKYANESLIRAKNVMQNNTNLLRIGTSVMTPSDFLIELGLKFMLIAHK